MTIANNKVNKIENIIVGQCDDGYFSISNKSLPIEFALDEISWNLNENINKELLELMNDIRHENSTYEKQKYKKTGRVVTIKQL